MNSLHANAKQHQAILQSIAQRVILERGLNLEFSAEPFADLAKIQGRLRPTVSPKCAVTHNRAN